MKLGLVVIPVPPDHPAYPVYQSQAEWLTGNEDTAGQLLDANWDAFLAVHRQLSVPYLMWALTRTIYARDDARQEALIRPLLAWIAEPVSAFTPAEKVRLEIAYGDIAVQRGQLREAAEDKANAVVRGTIVKYEVDVPEAFSSNPSAAISARRCQTVSSSPAADRSRWAKPRSIEIPRSFSSFRR